MTRRWSHPLSVVALLLVAAAVGVLAGGLIAEWSPEIATASNGLPKVLGRYQIVWVATPARTGSMRCYVMRPWSPGNAGLLLCG